MTPPKNSFANITSGLIQNFAKKYSFELVSSFRFNVAAAPSTTLLWLPIVAGSFSVASLIKGITLLTASLNSSKVALPANTVGLEKGH